MSLNLRYFMLLLVGLPQTASGTALPASAPVERGAIEQVFRTVESAIAARNIDGALAVYDQGNVGLLTQVKGEVQGWLALEGLHVTYRLGSVTGDRDNAEAVVLRNVTFQEHGRGQVDVRWETVSLRHSGAGWRIISEEERTFARTADTELFVEVFPQTGTMRGSATLKIEVAAPGED